ncbi:hypothetical protein [Sulfuricurvum sp.]|uniref:hypothetical protein n=1 Tax=Sulfuricurvum sp. TaxID=2025608 RepID=UPI003C58F632
MSTIIMMFILPLGILIYFWDRRNYAQSLTVFRDYISQMSHTDLPDTSKMDRIDEMFYKNGYTRIERSHTGLVVEKKHFNIGVLFISVGALTYFGLFLYLLYYRFILKPRRLSIDLGGAVMMREGKK